MNEWISVKDRLPDLGNYGCSENVLMVVANEDEPHIFVGFYYTEILSFKEDGGVAEYWEGWCYLEPGGTCGEKVDELDAVTHWMLLPELPEIMPDDRVELCEWYMSGEADKEESDEPGEISIYLSFPSKVKMDCDQDHIYIANIINELPPEIGKAFKEATDLLKAEPDNIKRNEKYADILDQHDEEWNAIKWPEGVKPFFDQSNWRDDRRNYVILKNYPENVIDKLFDIQFDWDYENADCGGGRIFENQTHIVLDDGSWLDALDVCGFVTVTADGRLDIDIMDGKD